MSKVQFELFGSTTPRSVDDIVRGLTLLAGLDIGERVQAINRIRMALHEVSPFASEPVDCVLWVPAESVTANDYNPNSVAPPEMKLLEHSISQDGYTQPIVSWKRDDSAFEVVDGFHRHRVGRESKDVRGRIHGYLPLVVINAGRSDRSDRIAATIRHNRARGKHKVEAMSDIVVELKRRNWADEKIARELGMDPDEVLRLCQITGLAEAFGDEAFSEAWEVDRGGEAVGGEVISDVLGDFEPDDKGRILHTWEKWECYRAGFYAERPPDGLSVDDGEERYREFLSDAGRFEAALRVVVGEWRHSCEHFLTNERMNRIAWLGQAAAAQDMRMPSCCRGGYHRLTDEQKASADALALRYLNLWLAGHGRPEATITDAAGRTEAELY